MAGKKMQEKKPQNTKEQNKKNQTIGDWLYFCPQEIEVRALYEALQDTYEAEIWEEAGVLEIMLSEKSSFDVEQAQIHPKDEITQQFADEQRAKCVFLATFAPEDYEPAERMMKLFLKKFGGIFCGDTEDFMPQLKG